MNKTVSLVVIVCCIFVSFQQVYAKRSKRFNCTEKIAHAIKRYKKGRYNDVKTVLDQVKTNCTGHAAMDTVLYYLGKAYLETKQPIQASIEFQILVQDFPQSSFNEEAHFLLGVCNYEESNTYERDQAKTHEAIRDFEDFAAMFPESQFADSAALYLKKSREKLVKKEFMNARFYEKIDKFDAAIVYYRIIIKNYPESSYIPECQYSLASNLVKVSRPREAIAVLNNLLSTDIDTELKKKAQLLLDRLRKQDKNEQPDTPQDSTGLEKASR